jgi:hypothetical protein
MAGEWRWRIEDLHNLYLVPDNNRMTQSRIMRWSRHVACMAPKRNLHITLICIREVMRLLGRSKCRGEGIIKVNILDVWCEVVGWILRYQIMISCGPL